MNSSLSNLNPLVNSVCQVKKLSPTAIVPTQGYPESAGFDLYSNEPVVIEPKSRAIISTGIAIQMPSIQQSVQFPFRVYGSIRSRSGLSAKNGIEVGAGVIDSNYTGEIKVVLHNHSSNVFTASQGTRIAQLVFELHIVPCWIEVSEFSSKEPNLREANGFGSSGL